MNSEDIGKSLVLQVMIKALFDWSLMTRICHICNANICIVIRYKKTSSVCAKSILRFDYERINSLNRFC